jgi:hypothetical protein
MLACVSGSTLMHEEKACCRAMHGHCGDMEKMGCCRNEGKTDNLPQLPSSAPITDLQWITVSKLATVPDAVLLNSMVLHKAPDEHSPPGLQIARTTNLRI